MNVVACMTTKTLSLVLLSCLAIACGVQGEQAKGDKVNPDAKLLQDFQARIEKYTDLQKKLKKQGPPMKETSDPAKINAAQDTLAQNIHAARKDARPGEIFTPEIRQLFRRLMYPELKGPDAPETKEALKEDAPAPGSIPLKVNTKYPESQPLPTVPPNLLASLPKLPEGLEYRIVGRTLILRDVDANLIVDFIPNAIR
jgi:hypothetical protein